MNTIEKRLLQVATGFGVLAAWLLLCDSELVPERFSLMTLGGITLHWQAFLALGVLLIAVRDQLSEMNCRCCGSHDDLSLRAVVKSREVLCNSCLAWDPGVAVTTVQVPVKLHGQPDYADLFDALK